MKYILVMTLRIRDTILINPFQILSLEQTKLLGGGGNDDANDVFLI